MSDSTAATYIVQLSTRDKLSSEIEEKANYIVY